MAGREAGRVGRGRVVPSVVAQVCLFLFPLSLFRSVLGSCSLQVILVLEKFGLAWASIPKLVKALLGMLSQQAQGVNSWAGPM